MILSVLRTGGVIGFPTDTAYGLGANPFDEKAIAQIFRLKGRPESKPILLLVDSLDMSQHIAITNPVSLKVAAAFWPGPLTMVLPARSNIPTGVTAGTGTVGVRWPMAGFATEIVRRLSGPITATSANRSGATSCVTAAEVRAQMGDSLDVLVDGGELPARGGSTLLDLSGETPILLREGPITLATLDASFEGNIRRPDA